jgi:GT2 family glycosyltransferase
MPATFTVAIPTHDRRETVILAIQSALEQSRAPEQVLVLCDGCHDATQQAVAALRDPRVEILDLPKGPGYAYDHRNRALERATGEAIVWLADDDLWLPDHLELIGALWDAGNADLVQTYAVHIAADDTLEWLGADWTVPHHQYTVLHIENTTPMGAVCVATQAARDVGGWDGSFDRCADWDLWKRVLRAGARTLSTESATLLHFRANGRVQSWPDRVAQNRRWLARVRDRQQQASLRLEIAQLRGVREGLWAGYVRSVMDENERLRGLLAQAGFTA